MTGSSDSNSGDGGDSKNRLFPETLWSLVGAASRGDPEKSAAALRELCRIYREPIVGRLLSQGYGQDSEDLAGGFIEFFLEKNRLETFDRREAKFRSFLLKCLKWFLRDEWRKRTAAKRGSGEAIGSIDEMELGQEEQLDKTLDRHFALTLHRRVMGLLAEEHRRKGEGARFDGLKPYVLGGDGSASYAEVGSRLGMTANNVKQAVLRLRGRYSDLFRGETMQIVAGNEIEQEMKYLISLLADTEACMGQ